MPSQSQPVSPHPEPRNTVLHISQREAVRPLRDLILRASGYDVESTSSYDTAVQLFTQRIADLVLIDITDQDDVHEAEQFCAEFKTIHHHQLVAFVCNWRVAIHTNCPDEILRTEFDPASFVSGVKAVFAEHWRP